MARGQYVSPSRLRRNLRLVTVEGTAFSIMVGVGETYLAAFAIAAGLGELAAGLITTAPVLGGSLLQLLSPWGVGWCRSYRRWAVGSAALQALSLGLLVLMARVHAVNVPGLFAVVTLYWAGGLAAGPAWNAWIEHLVPKVIRPAYFARRSRWCQAGVLVGIVMGGVWLRLHGSAEQSLETFAWLFGIASLCRFASVVCLAVQTETRHWMQKEPTPRASIRENWRAIGGWDPPTRSLVIYLMAMQSAVYVSGPFFTPYMLRSLQFSYLTYMFLISLGFAGKTLASPWAAAAARRWGADRLLWLGGLGIIPLSALWLVSQSVWYLAVIQVLGGALWSCYELSMLLLFFERIPKSQRVEVLSIYNVGNSAAMMVGSLVGAAILRLGSPGSSLFLGVFFVSSVLRLATLALLPRSNQQTHLLGEMRRFLWAARPRLGLVPRRIVVPIETPATLITPRSATATATASASAEVLRLARAEPADMPPAL